MDIADLRVALFSGNYNYVRDGANQALNRLADYLLRQGAALRVYAPKVANPAFPATGDLVPIPAVPIPTRSEYRVPLGLSRAARADLAEFRPNVLHVSSPDPTAHAALKWAEPRNLPVLASVHTRFDTYMRYYGLGFVEPWFERIMRRFYHRCDAIVAPSESMAEVLRSQDMSDDIGIWSRGVDREIFDPARRDLAWRRALGIGDDEVAVGFLGRVVMEKGLDVFADAMAELRRRGVPHKALVVGEGPARGWFAERVPEASFTGMLTHGELGRAVASMDMLLNPSVTETFGNVTLEAMASRVPVIAARAPGSTSLVTEGQTGRLVEPGDIGGFANAVSAYVADPALRAAHGAAGEERSRAYSWDAINRTVADVYLRLIEARRNRSA
ncbi:MAG TPA: glycosyltransferase family 1 protein [Croceibacterium sp.]|nr:glycosyltransferase family 1 protein [Croceibacterium sp.]